MSQFQLTLQRKNTSCYYHLLIHRTFSHFFSIPLTSEFDEIIKNYAEHVHDYLSYSRIESGWSYGEIYDDASKKHPVIKPYANLNKKEQLKYEELIRDTLKVIKTLGWTIDKADVGAQKQVAKLVPKKIKENSIVNGYYPKPFDLSSITLTRELIVRFHYRMNQNIV